MKIKLLRASGILLCLLFIVFTMPLAASANFEKTYNIQTPSGNISHQFRVSSPQLNPFGALLSQKLYVFIPPSLYNYYSNMSHEINDDSDYAKFVTPQAVASIAQNIQKITDKLPNKDEQFADAVLAMVHQIPYVISSPKYPVETLQDNYGDCVELSLLAASIMKAGGLDVILIRYAGITPEHINVGVYLPNKPVYHTLSRPLTSFEYDNKTYWTAEATPAGNWRVGDQSESLAEATPIIIPLTNTADSSPTQVSSSLKTPQLSSNLTINLSQQPTNTTENNIRALTISGEISPVYSGQNITIFVNSNKDPSYYFTTVTNETGGYSSTYNFISTGTYNITASWNGDSTYAGADSERLTIFVGPQSLVQFQTPEYNYILEPYGLAFYATIPFQGDNDFFSIPIGTNVSFSYDFTILPTCQALSEVQTTTVTIPESQEIIKLANGQIKTVQVPGENLTVPVNAPSNMQALRLEDNFNQTLNDQFCFVLQNINENNCSLNFKALTPTDITNLQSAGSSADFIDASQNIKVNAWYQTTTTISETGITSNIYRSDGTLIESTTNRNATNSSNTATTLITNNQNNAVVIKDLKIENLNQTQQPHSNEKTINVPSMAPFIALLSLLVATLISIFYVKRIKSVAAKRKSTKIVESQAFYVKT